LLKYLYQDRRVSGHVHMCQLCLFPDWILEPLRLWYIFIFHFYKITGLA
jgi:hypothetical protein